MSLFSRQRLSSIWERLKWLLLQGFVFGIVILAMSVMLRVWWETYNNDPPMSVTRLNPKHLGTLCPGQSLSVANHIEIEEPMIAVYRISTTDIFGGKNFLGTQSRVEDMQHPHPTSFVQDIPWTVPDLPPGNYMRVFSARNIIGNQNTIFTESSYSIGRTCNVQGR